MDPFCELESRNSAFEMLVIFIFHSASFGQVLVPIALPPKAEGSSSGTVILFKRSGYEAETQLFGLSWSAFPWMENQMFSLAGKTKDASIFSHQ